MDHRLTFVKLAGRWFVHLPNYPGLAEDLEMVMGADSFCQQLDKHNTGLLTVYVDTEPKDSLFTTQEYVFKFDEYSEVDDEIFGAHYYLETDPDFKIWLCNVTKYVFGEFPKTIYIRLC
jgi:hypothetical protein